MDLILLGMQGAGKGTLSRQLVEKYNVPLFETGAELRKLAEEDSELGQKVKLIIETGHLVSNEVIIEIIENFLKNASPEKPVLFDGIPRSLEQADLFDRLMKKHGRTYGCVMITLSEATALKRLTARKMCKLQDGTSQPAHPKDGEWLLPNGTKCPGKLYTRKDDTPEAIQIRIDTFKRETVPIMEKFSAEEVEIIEIDGEKTVKEVKDSAFEKLDPILK